MGSGLKNSFALQHWMIEVLKNTLIKWIKSFNDWHILEIMLKWFLLLSCINYAMANINCFVYSGDDAYQSRKITLFIHEELTLECGSRSHFFSFKLKNRDRNCSFLLTLDGEQGRANFFFYFYSSFPFFYLSVYKINEKGKIFIKALQQLTLQ